LSYVSFPSLDIQQQYSPALQQQISLLTANKDADYFLFDEEDCPVHIILQEMWLKMCFWGICGEILSSEVHIGLEALMEYLAKVMAQKPGLSQEMILAQLD
jgi:hypothetical protein